MQLAAEKGLWTVNVIRRRSDIECLAAILNSSAASHASYICDAGFGVQMAIARARFCSMPFLKLTSNMLYMTDKLGNISYQSAHVRELQSHGKQQASSCLRALLFLGAGLYVANLHHYIQNPIDMFKLRIGSSRPALERGQGAHAAICNLRAAHAEQLGGHHPVVACLLWCVWDRIKTALGLFTC